MMRRFGQASLRLALASLFAGGLALGTSPGARADQDPCEKSPEGALCNDGNTCTTGDICHGGVCLGTPAADGAECTDGNLCTVDDRCRSLVCVGLGVPDGTPCDDHNMCTTQDACYAAQCAGGTPLTCDDGIACTLNLCLPTAGCAYAPTQACYDAGTPADTATADATPPDLSPLPDASGDAPVDRPPDGAPADSAAPDAGTGDARASDVSPPVAEGGPPDAPRKTPDADNPSLDFRIEGGACVCSQPGGAHMTSSALPSLLVLLVTGLWALALQRKRAQPRPVPVRTRPPGR